MLDILLYESGNGGEAILRGNALATVSGYENTPYLSMFGGADWYGNYLVPGSPFTCKTEDALKSTPLSSAGRIAIQDAIKEDLSYLDDIEGTKWDVQLSILAPNKLSIVITINGQLFNYNWNPDEQFLTYQV